MTEEDGESFRSEEHNRIEMGRVQKEIVLHLKEYDTAPLNCTVSYMAQSLERTPDEIFEAVTELLSTGVICPWERWVKGAIVPYRLLDPSKLFNQDIDFSYEEIKRLTEPIGSPKNDVAVTIASGIGGPGKGYMISPWASENLETMSRSMKRFGLTQNLKKTSSHPNGKSIAQDLEISYLNNFYKSLYPTDEIEPLYALYSYKDEGLTAFRERTIKLLIEALAKISKNLLEKLDQANPPKRPYVFFFTSMIDHYLDLAYKVGLPEQETVNLSRIKNQIIRKKGVQQ